MHPLTIRPEAEADIAAAKKWYNAQREGLGEEFLQNIEASINHIRQFPEIHAASYRDVRQTMLRRFPYVLHYRFEGGRVTVVAVLHGSRHPRTWQRRR